MTTEKRYFYDTYAVIEFFKGNERFRPYFGHDCYGILTYMNILETHHAILREFGQRAADGVLKYFEPMIVNPNLDDLARASHFRLMHKGRRLSYVDCLGYVIAQREGARFLTGDIQFKGFNNVEFIR